MSVSSGNPSANLYAQLKRDVLDRTENTVRHHINELRYAGIVDVVRFEEGLRWDDEVLSREHDRVLSYSLPDSADPAVEEMIDAVQPQITDALATLTDEHQGTIEEISRTCSPASTVGPKNTRRTSS